MPTVLITGANRGLGLEFVKQYSERGWRVHACCRHPASASVLNELKSDAVSVHQLDVSQPDQIKVLKAELGDAPIDVLLSNAGAFGNREGFGDTDYETWTSTFAVNTLGPMRVAEALIDNVVASDKKLIANVTSKMGSIGDNSGGSYYIYRSTKAALNMVTKSMSLDLAPRGVTTVVLHPGWVQTDMGGASAPLTCPESITGMLKVLDGLSTADSGKFFDFSGAEIPW